MQVKVDRRMRNGLMVTNSYTLGRGWNYSDVAPAHPDRFQRGWGRTSFDVLHNYTGSFVYLLPWGPQGTWLREGVLSKVLGDWQVSGLFLAASGTPIDFTASAVRLGVMITPERLACLRALQAKVLWLATWMIHHANHVRPSRDGLKVGGHQASSASALDIMTALYFDVLRPEDRVAVKPHASPVFHAIQYLLGRQSRETLERFRALGGAQAYPSRTKDQDEVDFSTGSVGLGVALTLGAALAQDYVTLHGLIPPHVRPGRMIALAGDAEFDEGNVFEAMLEGWKHDVRNVWWIVDYNRQSLDSVVPERLFGRIEDVFRTTGFEVVELKYGTRLQEVFRRPGGEALRRWIDECPNPLYSALTFKGGTAWRAELERDLKSEPDTRAIVDALDDAALHELMTNLAGHDLESLLDAFHAVHDDRPRCFLAYTIKGYRLPLAGHRDNHAGMLTPGQMKDFQRAMRVPEGREWDPFVGLDVPEPELRAFLRGVPFAQPERRVHTAKAIPVPDRLDLARDGMLSTQTGFGRILSELGSGESDLARHLVTTSPDVTVSTNLGGWVNRRGIFDAHEKADIFRDERISSVQSWACRQTRHRSDPASPFPRHTPRYPAVWRIRCTACRR